MLTESYGSMKVRSLGLGWIDLLYQEINIATYYVVGIFLVGVINHAVVFYSLFSLFAENYIFSCVKTNSLTQVLRLTDNKPPHEYPMGTTHTDSTQCGSIGNSQISPQNYN